MYDLQHSHLAQQRREGICRRSVGISGKDDTNLARASASVMAQSFAGCEGGQGVTPPHVS
jgi:hypothetical protein